MSKNKLLCVMRHLQSSWKNQNLTIRAPGCL